VPADEKPEPGHRVRKKLATREALNRAAARLALERGLANVRVADVASAAGVSPRTYNNYFSSREEAICALRTERAEHIWHAMRARPADEPLATSLTEVLVHEYTSNDPDHATLRMIASEPALRGEFLKNFAMIETRLAEAIADRVALDAQADLLPRVLAAAATSTTRAAIEHWVTGDEPLAPLLREALTIFGTMTL
jgi:AcrR family transcriptional regulator